MYAFTLVWKRINRLTPIRAMADNYFQGRRGPKTTSICHEMRLSLPVFHRGVAFRQRPTNIAVDSVPRC